MVKVILFPIDKKNINVLILNETTGKERKGTTLIFGEIHSFQPSRFQEIYHKNNMWMFHQNMCSYFLENSNKHLHVFLCVFYCFIL